MKKKETGLSLERNIDTGVLSYLLCLLLVRLRDAHGALHILLLIYFAKTQFALLLGDIFKLTLSLLLRREAADDIIKIAFCYSLADDILKLGSGLDR